MRRFVMVAVVLGLGLVACGGRGPKAGEIPGTGGETGTTGATGATDCTDLTGGPATITIADFSFGYTCITVSASQGLTVENTDASAHTFTVVGTGAEALIDQTLDTGATYKEKTLSNALQPGTYGFFCRFHPPMKGTITVQ